MSEIFNPNYNDLPTQVEVNKRDIAKLKKYLQASYTTTVIYGDPPQNPLLPFAFPLSTTNIPLDTPTGVFEGYIITFDSKLLNIINIEYDPTLEYNIVNTTYVCDLQGEDGERGADGQDGQDGQNATSLSMGTVTEGDTAEASLTPVGDGDYELNLTLPRGAQGETGAQGPAGQNAVISGVTATIDSGIGTPDIDVVMTGTPQNRTFNFDFHNLKGENATSITLGTVTSGATADAELVSTGNGNYTLNLTLPKGEDGTDGKGFSLITLTSSHTYTWTNSSDIDYPYQAFIEIPGLTATSPVILSFGITDIQDMYYAPYCYFATVNGVPGVYIYSNTDNVTPTQLNILYYIDEGGN